MCVCAREEGWRRRKGKEEGVERRRRVGNWEGEESRKEVGEGEEEGEEGGGERMEVGREEGYTFNISSENKSIT